MRKQLLTLIIFMLLMAACGSAGGQDSGAPGGGLLLLTAGEDQQSFSAEDLGALPASEASFNEVAYKGVTILALLEAVGIQPAQIRAIKAVAADGYSVNYDPGQVLKDSVIVAYALADGGKMSADDGNFRMVLPDDEGNLNLRMLVELQILQ
jgi:hypothetical protein